MVIQRLSTTNIDFFVSQSNIQLQQFLITEIQINWYENKTSTTTKTKQTATTSTLPPVLHEKQKFHLLSLFGSGTYFIKQSPVYIEGTSNYLLVNPPVNFWSYMIRHDHARPFYTNFRK